jgi:cytochrome c551/c552
MSRFLKPLTALVLALAGAGAHAAPLANGFPGIGRTATPAEVAAWDIDVRPDFKGLPKGSGSVAKGQDVWESKCASCHGVFGESNEVFSPLVGGTTADDVKTGHVASLRTNSYPGRTTLMKVSQISALWDYINRAMPWTQPKSLSADDVYAVTAYLLNLGGVLPADFTLSDQTMGEAQARLPNRNGMTTDHALWPGEEIHGAARPDVNAIACMSNCAIDAKVTSMMPAHAANSHGNLAEQNRSVGPQRGIDTGKEAAAAADAKAASVAVAGAPATTGAAPAATIAAPAAARLAAEKAAVPAGIDSKAVAALLQKNNCIACHAASQRIVGPAWSEIAKKHPGKTNYLAGKIVSGGSGVWGAIPMPPQSLSEADARRVAAWLAAGATP